MPSCSLSTSLRCVVGGVDTSVPLTRACQADGIDVHTECTRFVSRADVGEPQSQSIIHLSSLSTLLVAPLAPDFSDERWLSLRFDTSSGVERRTLFNKWAFAHRHRARLGDAAFEGRKVKQFV